MIKRFSHFIGVLKYVFFKGFAASPFHSLMSIFFEGLSFFCVIAAATSLIVLASSGGAADLPAQIAPYIPEGKAALYGVVGLISALLGGAISRFFSSFAINRALPRVESSFYNAGMSKFAKLDIVDLSSLDFDIDKYLYKDLMINTRFAMMVFRFWMMAFVPLATLVVLIPTLAYMNLKITLAMLAVFILFMPFYYLINRRSNTITLDMEPAGRLVTGIRRDTSDSVLKTDFNTEQHESIIAPALAKNNKDVSSFFNLFGERFIMIEATNLTNAFVLFFVIGALAYFFMQADSGAVSTFNAAEFVVVLVVLRQVHTAVSRGLLVTNTMSRFYTKLFDLKTSDQKITALLKAKTKNTDEIIEPVQSLNYKHIDTEKGLALNIMPGNVHLVYDDQKPSRLSLIGIKPGTDVKNFTRFIQTRQIETVQKTDMIFSFEDHNKTPQAIDAIIRKHEKLLTALYDADELRRVPETPMTFVEILQSTLGDGISYLRPRTIKTYACIIDLKLKLMATKHDVVFLDARALMHLQPPYTEKALEMMQRLDKTVFITLSKLNYANVGFNAERPVIIKGRTKADGYIEYGQLSTVVDRLNAAPDTSHDDDMDLV